MREVKYILLIAGLIVGIWLWQDRADKHRADVQCMVKSSCDDTGGEDAKAVNHKNKNFGDNAECFVPAQCLAVRDAITFVE